MKRWYKCIKTYLKAGWKEGDRYELDEAEADESVVIGLLEPEPIDEEELRLQRALDRFNKQKDMSHTADITKIVAGVLEAIELKRPDSAGPLRVKVVQDEKDKIRSFGHWVQCIGLLADNQAKPHLKQIAARDLEEVYQSKEDPTFGQRFAEAEARTKGISLKAALAESSGITGGYTVPPEFSMDLLEFEPEDTVLVGQTDEFPMTGRELKMPVLDQTATGTVGQTAYFGGIVAYWTAEAALRQETEPKFREVSLVANELSGFALASRNVLYDNKVALEQRLTRLFGGAIGWYRDYAYLQGDGVGKPRGIVGAPATINITRATPNAVGYADLAKMLGSFMPQSMRRGCWVMQQSVLQNFLQMTDASNRLIVQPYFPRYVEGVAGGPATVAPVMSIFGMPIKTTEKLPTLGTPGDLMLIDPKQYFSATRADVEIAASEHYKFLNNQITYRFIFRGDGEPWPSTFFTLQDGTTTISPFVRLGS